MLIILWSKYFPFLGLVEKMWNNRKNYLLILFLMSFCIKKANGQFTTINVTGQWNQIVNQTDLEGGAGSNLRSIYTSSDDQVRVTFNKIYFPGGWYTWDWAVDIHKQDINWHTDLILEAQRTGSGECNQDNYSISGGESYITITDSDMEFFSGRISGEGNWLFTRFRVRNIPIQYRISGVSAALPSQTYSTTIYYTIRDE